MFTIVTGLQGHGKTLLMIQMALILRDQNPGRTIYYHGIPEVKIPGFAEFMEPEKWYELPQGAIILIDEIQLYWPDIDTRQPKTPITRALTLIRKNGHDLICGTQDIMQLSKRYRALSNKHIHLVRIFGHDRSTRYQWEKVQDNPDDYHAKQDAEKDIFKFPKELYGKYKSADVHISRKRIPRKLMLIPVGLLFVLGMVGWGYYTLFGGRSATEIAASVHPVNVIPGMSDKPVSRALTPVEYAERFIPRINDLPYTAPVYDVAFEVKTFPKPQCIYNHKKNDCRCYSQQATRLNVGWDMCMRLIENGWFDPTIDPDKKQDRERYDYLADNYLKLKMIEARERREQGFMENSKEILPAATRAPAKPAGAGG